LNYHIVPTTWFTAGFFNGKMLQTLATSNTSSSNNTVAAPLDLTLTQQNANSSWVVNNISNIIIADLVLTNGAIQVIDHVLIPPMTIYEINELHNLSSLNSALVATGLASDLNNPAAGPFTEFAPTNDAFSATSSDVTGSKDSLEYLFLTPSKLNIKGNLLEI
jgi:uncharacterized surface protein with fasciclin (FAS1) repeats